MGKVNERLYPERIAEALGVSDAEVRRHLLEKPFRDELRGRYFNDFGQILSFLPPAKECRLLDLGVGAGWTSRFLAQCGYAVVGLDISETMIAYAREASVGIDGLTFMVVDCEHPLELGTFDAALIYDALHHAEDESAVIRNVFRALKPGGVLITAEPGAGHAAASYSIEAMERFGVTEKDMEYARQRKHMLEAGFSQVRHYLRLSELAIVDLAPDGGTSQRELMRGFVVRTLTAGTSSIVVAVKGDG